LCLDRSELVNAQRPAEPIGRCREQAPGDEDPRFPVGRRPYGETREAVAKIEREFGSV